MIYEVLERTTDSTRREPGVRTGIRRTGRYVTERMPITDRFAASLSRPAPYGYAVSARDTAVLRLLTLHGVTMYRTRADWSGDAGPQYVVDSTVIAPRVFQGSREVRLVVSEVPGKTIALPVCTVVVPLGQPLGVLVMYLLEPESDDGVVNWDVAGLASTNPSAMVVTR